MGGGGGGGGGGGRRRGKAPTPGSPHTQPRHNGERQVIIQVLSAVETKVSTCNHIQVFMNGR